MLRFLFMEQTDDDCIIKNFTSVSFHMLTSAVVGVKNVQQRRQDTALRSAVLTESQLLSTSEVYMLKKK